MMRYGLLVTSFLLAGAVGLGAANQRTDRPAPSLIPSDVSGDHVFKFFCASCHGAGGRGDGPLAPTLSTAPSNLTQLTWHNGGAFPRHEVEQIITIGRPVPAHGTSDMPVWGSIFQALEPSDGLVKARIKNLVDYVETLQER